MEPILINRCRMDETTLKTAFTLISRRSRIVLLAGAGLMLALAVLLTCLGNLDLLTFILYVGAGVYAFLALRQPGRLTRLQIQRFEEAFQTDHLETWVELFADAYQSRRENAVEPSSRTQYAQIRRILEARGVIVLQTQARQFVILDAGRFEKGTEADFWKLMQEVCPTALPKSRRV